MWERNIIIHFANFTIKRSSKQWKLNYEIKTETIVQIKAYVTVKTLGFRINSSGILPGQWYVKVVILVWVRCTNIIVQNSNISKCVKLNKQSIRNIQLFNIIFRAKIIGETPPKNNLHVCALLHFLTTAWDEKKIAAE